MKDLIDRLNGIYTLPVNDGSGLLNGKDTVTRKFDVPAINKEAAREIVRLEERLEERVTELEQIIEILRRYGNKDCTAMADEAIAKLKQALKEDDLT